MIDQVRAPTSSVAELRYAQRRRTAAHLSDTPTRSLRAATIEEQYAQGLFKVE